MDEGGEVEATPFSNPVCTCAPGALALTSCMDLSAAPSAASSSDQSSCEKQRKSGRRRRRDNQQGQRKERRRLGHLLSLLLSLIHSGVLRMRTRTVSHGMAGLFSFFRPESTEERGKQDRRGGRAKANWNDEPAACSGIASDGPPRCDWRAGRDTLVLP